MASISALPISLFAISGSFLLVIAAFYYFNHRKRASSNPRVLSVSQNCILLERERSADHSGDDAELGAIRHQHMTLASIAQADLLAKVFPVSSDAETEDDAIVPPRMLFTIKEETKEDLELEDARFEYFSQPDSSEGSSCDLLLRISADRLTPSTETHFIAPASPPTNLHEIVSDSPPLLSSFKSLPSSHTSSRRPSLRFLLSMP